MFIIFDFEEERLMSKKRHFIYCKGMFSHPKGTQSSNVKQKFVRPFPKAPHVNISPEQTGNQMHIFDLCITCTCSPNP